MIDANAVDQNEQAQKTNGLQVDIQIALAETAALDGLPSEPQFESWATIAYQFVSGSKRLPEDNEVTLRFVDEAEIHELNESYRGKDKPTNVLSFPFEMPESVDISLLGDVIICHQVVISEAQAQGKSADQHYAHMVTHGILHLCGYDHEDPEEADEMEALEIKILALSDIPNPYSV